MSTVGAPELSTSRAGSLLYVATVAPSIHKFLLPYAEHLRALGWRVDAAANGATEDPLLRRAFDHVYELPFSRSIRDLPSLVRGARALSHVLASGPEIVHVHTPIAGFMARWAVHRLPMEERPAIAYTAHGFHFHSAGNPLTNALFLTAERVAGRWTDRLVVINDEDREAALRHRLVIPGRLVPMPGIGIDTNLFARSTIGAAEAARARLELGVGSGLPLFVFVGELNRNKRPGDAIAALGMMRHEEAHLVLVGPGPLQARLEELAGRRGVAQRIHFTGLIDDVRPIVGDATALVLPSEREGLARSIMEALSLEVPVVASTARGNRQLVGDDGGFVVPTGDVPGLAAKMDWLVDHPVEAGEMGRQGRARMVAQYDLEILIRRHEQLYAGMIASRGTRPPGA